MKLFVLDKKYNFVQHTQKRKHNSRWNKLLYILYLIWKDIILKVFKDQKSHPFQIKTYVVYVKQSYFDNLIAFSGMRQALQALEVGSPEV